METRVRRLTMKRRMPRLIWMLPSNRIRVVLGVASKVSQAAWKNLAHFPRPVQLLTRLLLHSIHFKQQKYQIEINNILGDQ